MIKILTLITLLVVSGCACAGSTEESPFNARHEARPAVFTECVAGQLFVIASSPNGVALMQAFQDDGDMVPKPIECPLTEYDIE